MRVRRFLLPLVLGTAFLAGCATANPSSAPTTPAPTDNGVSALTATEILAKATTALEATKSFHVKGTETDAGQTVTVDLVLTGDGANTMGTFVLNNETISITKIGTDLYVKLPDDLLKQMIPPAQQAAALALVSGKWVKGSTTGALGSFVISPADILKPTGTLTKGDASTVNGQPVIALVDTDGSKMYIATVGQPYPVEIQNTSGTPIDFSDINADVTFTPPAAADTVSLPGLS